MAEDLLDTYRLAQRSDPQLAAAEANYLATSEAKAISRGGILPSLNLSASGSRRIDDTTYLNPLFDKKIGYNNYGYRLELRQTIYRRDNFLQLDEADTRILQAKAEYQAAEQELILRLAKAYFEVLAAQDTLHFARAEKESIARQLEQTQQRFEVGLTAITDVNEAQARYDLVNAQEIEARFRLDDKREALREITGQYPERPATLRKETPLPAPEPADPNAWNKTALEQNLTLRTARLASELAALQVKRSRSNHYPTLDLALAHNYSKGGSFVDENTTNSIGLEFNLPLYTGGSVSAAVRQARHQFDAAKQNLERQHRATEASTRTAYRGVTASIVRVQALKQAVISNQSALDATEAGYEVGTRTSVDVLNARRELFRAQRDYAQSRYDYIIGSLALKDAAGMLSYDDLAQINQWLRDSTLGQP
nr:TolC family outer membrane protein [Gammaproteobacteria bacterium]